MPEVRATVEPPTEAEAEAPTLVGPAEPQPDLPADDAAPGPRHRVVTPARVIALVVVLAAAGVGLGLWLTSSSTPSGATVTDETVAVTTGTIQKTVSTTGTVQPANQANLNFGASGRVTSVAVAAGQSVQTGQVLATIDNAGLLEQVDTDQATVDSDEARLESDQSSGASSAQQAADQAQVTAAQDQLNTATQNEADATLTSPIAGTVAAVTLTVGQQVTGSSGSGSTGSSPNSSGSGGVGNQGAGSTGSSGNTGSSGSSSAQVVVVGTGSYVVNASVDDTEVGQIAQGDQAVITLGSGTGSTGGGPLAVAGGGGTASAGSTPYYGTVSSVGLIASTSSGVASFPVTIQVTGTPSGLYSGASANVSIVVQQLTDVTEVPTAALRYSGGQTDVVVLQNGQKVTRPVTVGAAAAGETQILSGVHSGQKVVEQVVRFSGLPAGAGGAGGFTRRFSGGAFPVGGGGFGGPGGFGGGGPK
jgi:multidrug efflux pump subunit AcrA (membrane-fusion protein)